MRNRLYSAAAACLFSAALLSCGNPDSTTTDTTTTTTNTDTAATTGTAGTGGTTAGGGITASNNIVQNAQASPDHSTLVQAAIAAGLSDSLSSTGPYTVFAPTNAAFEALPAGTVDNLLQPNNRSQLRRVLTYHVVPGTLRAADLSDGQRLRTVQGQELTVKMRDGMVMIDSARVTTPDLVSSNGVIHVVDAVMMPKK